MVVPQSDSGTNAGYHTSRVDGSSRLSGVHSICENITVPHKLAGDCHIQVLKANVQSANNPIN